MYIGELSGRAEANEVASDGVYANNLAYLANKTIAQIKAADKFWIATLWFKYIHKILSHRDYVYRGDSKVEPNETLEIAKDRAWSCSRISYIQLNEATGNGAALNNSQSLTKEQRIRQGLPIKVEHPT